MFTIINIYNMDNNNIIFNLKMEAKKKKKKK